MPDTITPFRRHAIREICAAGTRLLSARGLDTDLTALRSMRAGPDELLAGMASIVLAAFGDDLADLPSDVAAPSAEVIPMNQVVRADGVADFDAYRTRQMIGKAALYPSNGGECA